MGNVQNAACVPRGLSFGIGELMLVAAWAEAAGLEMTVCLDHGSETEEYEEVISFRTLCGRPQRVILWRDRDSVHVQPLIGRSRRYESVSDAIEALSPTLPVVVTDVMASRWP